MQRGLASSNPPPSSTSVTSPTAAKAMPLGGGGRARGGRCFWPLVAVAGFIIIALPMLLLLPATTSAGAGDKEAAAARALRWAPRHEAAGAQRSSSSSPPLAGGPSADNRSGVPNAVGVASAPSTQPPTASPAVPSPPVPSPVAANPASPVATSATWEPEPTPPPTPVPPPPTPVPPPPPSDCDIPAAVLGIAALPWNHPTRIREDIDANPWLPYAHCYCDEKKGGGCGIIFYRVSIRYDGGPEKGRSWCRQCANVTIDVTDDELTSAAGQPGGVDDFLMRVYYRVHFGVEQCQSAHNDQKSRVRGPQYTVMLQCRLLKNGNASSSCPAELRYDSNATTTTMASTPGGHHHPRHDIAIPFTQVSFSRWLMWQQYHGIFEWHGLTWIIWAMQYGMNVIKHQLNPALRTTTPYRRTPEGPIVGSDADPTPKDIAAQQLREHNDRHFEKIVRGFRRSSSGAAVPDGGKKGSTATAAPNRTWSACLPPLDDIDSNDTELRSQSRGRYPTFSFAYRDYATNVDYETSVKTVMALSNVTLGYPRTTVMTYPFVIEGATTWPYSFVHHSYWDVPLQGTDLYYRAIRPWAHAMRRRLFEQYPQIRDVPLNKAPAEPTLMYDWRPRDVDDVRGRRRGINETDEGAILATLHNATGGVTHLRTTFHHTDLTFYEQLTLVRKFKYFLHGEGAFNLWMLVAVPGSTFVIYYDNMFTDPKHLRDVFVWIIKYTTYVWRLSDQTRIICVSRERGSLASMELLKKALARPFKAEVVWVKPGEGEVIDLTPPAIQEDASPDAFAYDDILVWK